MSTKLITPPASEPVTVTEIKEHLRVDASDEDSYLGELIIVARKYIEEQILHRALITQTWEYYLDSFPVSSNIKTTNYEAYLASKTSDSSSEIELPYPKLQSITSIKYKDKGGVETTISSGDYIADTNSEPGKAVLAYGKSWPSSDALYPVDPITVKFIAGYGDSADVPEPIKQALKIIVADLYENRESFVIGSTISAIPRSAEVLLQSYRMFDW